MFLFFILAGTFAVTAEVLPEEQRLEQINKKLELSKEQLKKAKEEEQAVLGRLVLITKELKKTKNNLFRTQQKIQVNETEIDSLTSDLSEAQDELNELERKLGKRVREVYKSSGVNYIQLLFAADSMSEFLNQLYFFRKVIDYDSWLVQNVRDEVQRVKFKRSALQLRTSQIRSMAKEISEKKLVISQQAQEKEQVYKTLQQRRKEYEANVAELEKSSKELEVLILKKMAARQGSKVQGSGVMAWPLEGKITSRFGYRRHPLWGGRHFHTGLDISGKYGTPIRAADSGEIIFAGWWDGYGKAVVIDHGRMTTTVYGHLSRIYKKVGAVVAKGQTLGLVGSTGYSTGPHLHFEVRKNGKPVDPAQFLN